MKINYPKISSIMCTHIQYVGLHYVLIWRKNWSLHVQYAPILSRHQWNCPQWGHYVLSAPQQAGYQLLNCCDHGPLIDWATMYGCPQGGICWRGRMRGGNRCGIPSMMAWTLAAYVVTYDSSAYRSPISHGHLPAGYQQQPLGLTITVNTPTMSSGPLRQL